MPELDLDTKVKLAIYEITAETGSVPNSSEVSRKIDPPSRRSGATGIDEAEVLGAFGRLHANRLVLPEPGDPRRIRMAPPFSGVPTKFPVEANGKKYYANCVWDAYGIAAALHSDAISRASDGHTGEPLMLEVKNGAPVLEPYVAHFAVPAAHWWDDLVFT
jgi:Alkylmercury lyase